jgi:starch phosphorylase
LGIEKFWYPVFLTRAFLANLGIRVVFLNRPCADICDCDALIISSLVYDLRNASDEACDRAFAELTAWKARVREAWPGVKVVTVTDGGGPQAGTREVAVGDQIPVAAWVELAGLDPADIRVEAFHSSLHPDGSLRTGRGVALELAGHEDGRYLYRGAVPARASGLHGYAVRVLPRHEDVLVPNELPLITWEEGEE